MAVGISVTRWVNLMQVEHVPQKSQTPVTRLFDVDCVVGESPYWDAASSALWWVDAGAMALFCGNAISGAIDRYALSVAPSFIAHVNRDTVLLAAGRGWYELRLGDERLSLLAEPARTPSPDWRMNDGIVDTSGRVWTGSIGLPRGDTSFGALYRWDDDGVHQLVDDLLTQNGLAVSPDGHTLYLADSHPSRARVWSFDLDVSSGDLSHQRIFHICERGRPDGAAIDCQGGYWLACIDASEIVRLSATDGTVTHRVSLPVSHPTNICFGGPDMRRCFVTSMRAGLDTQALASEQDAGAVFTFQAPFAGLPQPIPTVFTKSWPSEAMPAASH